MSGAYNNTVVDQCFLSVQLLDTVCNVFFGFPAGDPFFSVDNSPNLVGYSCGGEKYNANKGVKLVVYLLNYTTVRPTSKKSL